MAYTCPKCGWKHKPSQEKYYRSKGLVKPICEDCNPSLKQKLNRMLRVSIVNLFSNTYMGYGPFASIPYIPVVLLIPAGLMYFSQGGVANVMSVLCFLIGWVANSYVATKVGDKLRVRLFRGKSVCLIIFGYYTPLLLIVIGVGIVYL
ncbi:hypothetical protein EAY27_20670 [Vibrio anguillarum]|uniref:Uncharacterized protein n=4 Tax=Vibrio anguillarum TaxID=55601 RepID=A0A289GHH3_VIBAN|nr:hypothetical protein CK207_17640 [Vibrio anguillarum]AZS27032.1 hypothetical protein DYL72_19115 [Vibrio anguillarum]MBF4242102.1 hypothetical protein [Vibrio anguillarum]MBF4258679.1 hypothetical protein [Vibrio anguillarum]MBF4279522.1 hypothetical protein [Vibrio anguillarum]